MYRPFLLLLLVWGCTDVMHGQLSYQLSQIFELPLPMQACDITASIVSTGANCSCNGTVSLTIQGGSAPYDIVWSNADTNTVLNNLCAGSQLSVTITDSQGCQPIQTPTVTVTDEALPLTIQNTEIVSPACDNQPTGIATIHISGGLAPYIFTWKNTNNALIGFDSTVSNLVAGTYFLTITDQCMPTHVLTHVVQVNDTSTLQIENIQTQVAANIISAEADITGGTTPYTYLWCNGNTANQASNLQNGICSLVVTDAIGCSQQQSFVVDETLADSISIEKYASCWGICNGSATVRNIDFGQPPYQYIWSSGEVTQTALNLCGGLNVVQIIDANGDETQRSVFIPSIEPIAATILATAPTAAKLADGSLSVLASGGTPPYTYQWNVLGASDNQLIGIEGGEYTVIIIDAMGCDTLIMATVGSGPLAECLSSNSILTPNNDGSNDILQLACINGSNTFERIQVQVFNRWGQEVFRSDDYDNTWAGTDRYGKILPTGSYFIFAEGISTNNIIAQHKGYINLFAE